MQGYYNPLAAQFDTDLEKLELASSNDDKSSPATIPSLNKSLSVNGKPFNKRSPKSFLLFRKI